MKYASTKGRKLAFEPQMMTEYLHDVSEMYIMGDRNTRYQIRYYDNWKGEHLDLSNK